MHERLIIVRNGQRQAISIRALRHGADGNEQTLREAASMVREDSASDQELRSFVQNLISDCAPGDYPCAVSKLFEFSRDAIHYGDDPFGVERIADAWATLNLAKPDEAWGDCGDKAILLATMLGVIGIPSQFIVQNWQNDVLDHGFDHVHVEAFMPDGSILQLDPTPRSAVLGWEAPSAVRMRFEIWPGVNGQSAKLDRVGVGSIWDQIAPSLITQGVQFGSQFAQSEIQQSRQSSARSAAEQQVNTQWESLVASALPVFQSVSAKLPNITADDLAGAVAAYQALESFVAQYPTPYVLEQWNSPAYKAAAVHDLNLYQSALTALGSAASGTSTATTSVAGIVQSLTENPLIPITAVFALVMLLKRGS